MQRRARIRNAVTVLGLVLCAASNAWAGSAYTIETANGFVRTRDWNGLLGYASAWTRAEPNSPMAWFYLGNTYGQGLRRPKDALPAFERAVALQANWPQAWDALGFVNVELKHYAEAVTAFSRAIQQAPANASYWNSLAATYSYQNRIGLAVKTLEDEQRTIATSTMFVDWYNLGNGFCTMQEPAAAAGAYRRAIQLKPDFAPAWNNLGTIEGLAGNSQAALRDYQQAAALGDALGATNSARLQQMMAAAQQRNSDDPLRQLWRAQAADLQYRTQQAWQDRLARAQN